MTSSTIKNKVHIIGAGISGLVAAYKLAKRKTPVILHEATDHLGGRILTLPDFLDGMYAEAGAEAIDVQHHAVLELVKEINKDSQTYGLPPLELEQPYADDSRDDYYWVGGEWYTPRELKADSGIHVLMQRINDDFINLKTPLGLPTALAKRLDKLSIRQYLADLKQELSQWCTPGECPAEWVYDLLEVAYSGQFGLEIDQLSALNLVTLISLDSWEIIEDPEDFAAYGQSDESLRLKGGFSQLIARLRTLLMHMDVEIQYGQRLVKLEKPSPTHAGLLLHFEDKETPVFSYYTIMTIPFSVLRHVEGLQELPLSSKKKVLINELQYGKNVKVIFGIKEPFWLNSMTIRQETDGTKIRSHGTFYTDEEFLNNVWATSHGQGQSQRGILTCLIGGKETELDPQIIIEKTRAALKKMFLSFPSILEKYGVAGIDAQFEGMPVQAHVWHTNPYALGSYVAAAPGQFLLMPYASEPELNDKLFFAGEHTAMEDIDRPDNGYVDSAIQSGVDAAQQVFRERRRQQQGNRRNSAFH